jgi:hypothetical protein
MDNTINFSSTKLLNTINWTSNFILPDDWLISDLLKKTVSELGRIITEGSTIQKIETWLRHNFWTDEIIIEGIRVATAIWLQGTQIHRQADNIILNNGKWFPQNNMWWNVVDPIWWASRSLAPSEDYWFFWKIPELRPNSKDFNEELYMKVREAIISTHLKWFAVEKGKGKDNKEETAIMPVYAIQWELLNGLVTPFSEKFNKDDIPTSKYFLLNQDFLKSIKK